MTKVKRRVSGGNVMAYVIVTIGALMFVVGLYAIVSGARIIQVEEGWASVIAGATLVAGGAITVALGLVMRLLRQLKTALAERPAAEAFEAPAAMAPGTEAPTTEAPTTEAPPLVDVPPVGQPLRQATMIEKSSPAVVPESETPEVATEVSAISSPPIPRSRWRKAPLVEEPAPAHEELSSLAPEPVEAYEPTEHQIQEAVHPADDYKLETPSSPEHDLPQVDSQQESPPPQPTKPSKEVDWLDQALAQIDEELPIRAPGRQIEAPSPKVAAKPSEPRLPKAATEPAKVEAKPSAPEHAAASSAVIGRYEADGTSYVMYADGSIEAQSEAGVFRFASMAELRSHIEG